ncbi:MAG: dihydrolipoamide acetyltransferase family protein [Bdellovibrionota bacterium]
MQFKLPELGEGVHEGELIKWKVKPGDQIKYDQPLCEIMTDKATVEIPSMFQGKVAELHCKEGDVVQVGQLMLTFEGALKDVGASPSASHAHAPAPAAVAAKPLNVGVSPASSFDSNPASRVLASPSTRRMAREKGINLAQVSGSGPHGRVMREDLERGGSMSGGPSMPSMMMRSTPAKTPTRPVMDGGEERVPFRGLRKKIAEKMTVSKHKAAHFTFVEEADASELVKLRTEAKDIGARQGVKVTYLPFVMKAMVAALRHYPILNSSLDEEKGELVYKHYYNIGLSVQTDDGLTAPVIKDVANKNVFELARDIQGVVDRARTKRLTLDDFEGSTITLTNAGSIGGLFATPIINYPEVAIMGFNKIARKPVVKTINGREEIMIRDWTLFSLSLDHRVVDGAIGAEFMKLFIKYIETPSLLLLESF